MRALHLLAASLLLLAASCGGSADAKTLTDEGYTALNQGDHDTAFEQLGSGRFQLIEHERIDMALCQHREDAYSRARFEQEIVG